MAKSTSNGPSGPFETPYRRPQKLRLRGVTLEGIKSVEEQHEKQLRENAEAELRPLTPQHFIDDFSDKVPLVFTTLAEWPCRTSLHCWQCSLQIEGVPVSVPTWVREDEKTGSIVFGVEGIMCNFNCAVLWINKTYARQPDSLWRFRNYLNLLYFMFTGHKTNHIREADDKTKLKMYGGDWDVETFRLKQKELANPLIIRDVSTSAKPQNMQPPVPEHDRVAVLHGLLAKDVPRPENRINSMWVVSHDIPILPVVVAPAAPAPKTPAAGASAPKRAAPTAPTPVPVPPPAPSSAPPPAPPSAPPSAPVTETTSDLFSDLFGDLFS